MSETLEDKWHDHFGGVPGRYANRIKNASFEIDGKTYKVDANEHGGRESIYLSPPAKRKRPALLILTQQHSKYTSRRQERLGLSEFYRRQPHQNVNHVLHPRPRWRDGIPGRRGFLHHVYVVAVHMAYQDGRIRAGQENPNHAELPCVLEPRWVPEPQHRAGDGSHTPSPVLRPANRRRPHPHPDRRNSPEHTRFCKRFLEQAEENWPRSEQDGSDRELWRRMYRLGQRLVGRGARY